MRGGVGGVCARGCGGCPRVRLCTYRGTAEEWECVAKGARWKDYAAFDEVRFGEGR